MVKLAKLLTLQRIVRIGDDGSLATVIPGTQLEDRAAVENSSEAERLLRYSATTPKSLLQTVLK